MSKLILTSIAAVFFFAASGQESVSQQDCVKIVRIPLYDGGMRIYATINSKKQGYDIILDSLGRIESESCNVDDKWTGPFIDYHRNGQVMSRSYVIDGHYDGPVCTYYSNGVLASKTYFKMDMRHGISESYTENGELDKRFLFRNDTLVRILEDHGFSGLPPGLEPLEKD